MILASSHQVCSRENGGRWLPAAQGELIQRLICQHLGLPGQECADSKRSTYLTIALHYHGILQLALYT